MRIFKLVIILTIITFFLLIACTSTPKQATECEKDLQLCQQQLASEQAQFNSDLKSCQMQVAKLINRRGQLEKHLEECQLSASEIVSDKDAAIQREAKLRSLLQTELGDKNVEIEFLKGRLTVRMLNRIMFNSGSAVILPSGQEVLDKLVQALIPTQDTIRVVGHTDNVRIGRQLRAKYPSNWELSAARAASVVRYFQATHEILPQRMEAVGLSKYHPLEDNDNEQNRQRNRRVEIILTAKD